MNLFLPEFDPEERAAPRLCILLKGEPAALARVRESIAESGGEFRLTEEGMAIWAPAGAAADLYLTRVAAAVDRASLQAGSTGQLELLETRLAPAATPPPPEVKIGSRFTLVFEEAPDPPQEGSLYLAASGVFGSGLHPSTRLAVQALEELGAHSRGFPERVLDVGTGSGLLALLAARLGARQVLGVDISPEAVAAARHNVCRNNLAHLIRITDQPVAALEGCCGLVLANLTASVLHRLADDLVARLEPRGQVIVSGLQGRQAAEITEAFRQKGLRELAAYREGNWRALRLQAG